MKRRKKPKASSQVRDRYPIEKCGCYPYLVRFLEWFASRGYSPRTTELRADALKRFHVADGGFDGQLLRQQEIACVAGLDGDDVSAVAELFDVFLKNYFLHCVSLCS